MSEQVPIQLYRRLKPEQHEEIQRQDALSFDGVPCSTDEDAYSIGGGSAFSEEAARLLAGCNHCPKLDRCTYEAAEMTDEHQIRGGTAPRERTALDKRIGALLARTKLDPESAEYKEALVASRFVAYRQRASNRFRNS